MSFLCWWCVCVSSFVFLILPGARVVRRTHDSVLNECHTLLLENYRRVKDWKKVVQTLKSASLSHEGDEEAKQDQMLMGHTRRGQVKAKIASQNQASVAAEPTTAAVEPPVPASQPAILHGDTFQEDDNMGDEPNTIGAPQPTNNNDTSHAPWHVYLAQNISKVSLYYMFVVRFCLSCNPLIHPV